MADAVGLETAPDGTPEGLARGTVPDLVKDMVGGKPVDKAAVFRRTVYAVTGLGALALATLAVLTAVGRMPWPSAYYTDLGLLALVLALGPPGIFYLREVRRTEGIDDKFPEFLRDLAESARSGMTLPRALSAAARGSYGVLTPEIVRMSAQVEWGVSFNEALQRFSERLRSSLVTRTVSLISEARKAGGNVVDVLTAAAEDAREIRQVVQQRQAQMASYSIVVYITFIVFVAVVLILQGQLVPAFAAAAKSAQSVGADADFGGLDFGAVDEEGFTTLFFHATIIQAITGGLVAGILTRGNPVAGLWPTIFMLLFCELSFRVLAPLAGTLLAGMM